MILTNSINYIKRLLLFLPLLVVTTAMGQPSSMVPHNGHDLWVSGTNVAWVNFARDIGPGTTRFDLFESMFRDLRNSGGNSMRLWLHTTGSVTPQWNGNMVIGPGVGAVEDLRNILDLAQENDISLMLCLWSFDMLRISNGASVTDRSFAILTQPANRMSYMDNSLKPMVEALKGHPAILAWEIFNEAEGMSDEFGWDFNRKVPMINIQQFVNQAAGVIKRADPNALVTTGAWSFKALSDVHVSGSNTQTDMNYYRNDRLIGFGGDPMGILDFYTVHYYDWAGTSLSPFHNDVSVWKLDKPVVVAEFYAKSDIFGVKKEALYQTLRNRGYAGALSWQWVDWAQNRENNAGSWPNTLVNTRAMWNNHGQDVVLSYDGLQSDLRSSATSVEPGSTVWLRWDVRGAVSVELNGDLVYFLDSLAVTPQVNTTYELSATGRNGSTQTWTVQIKVLPPDQLNRSENKRGFSSTGDPSAALDGDSSSSWSSGGDKTEYLYVDLDGSYDISKVILRWGATKPTSYTISHSFDAVVWTDAHNRNTPSTADDELLFNEPLYTRFIRLSTSSAISLSELETYGLRSTVQRFRLDITSPKEGDNIEGEATITLAANLVRRAGPVSVVRFYVNGELVGSKGTSPYSVGWFPKAPGDYEVSAQVTDGSYLINARPVKISVYESVQKKRYEAESAKLSGSLTVVDNATASGGKYVLMENDGSITWDNISVLTGGPFTLRFGYYLPFDYKAQDLRVNDGSAAFLPFNPPTQVWSFRDTTVTLVSGINKVSLSKNWGYMWFDYLEVRGNNQYATSLEDDADRPTTYQLYQNYPNPFNPSTIIKFEIPSADNVRLDVYDITGRLVKTLINQRMNRGIHETSFQATGLSTGVYLYRLKTSAGTISSKMLLIK